MWTPTVTNLTGTPSSPETVAATGSVNASLTLAAGSGVATGIFTGHLSVEVVTGGTPPSANPLVQFTYSDDGTKYYNDISYPVPMVANATFDYDYSPPTMGVQAIGVEISNPGSVPITVLVQGTSVVQS
jgi:hypothetical protein